MGIAMDSALRRYSAALTEYTSVLAAHLPWETISTTASASSRACPARLLSPVTPAFPCCAHRALFARPAPLPSSPLYCAPRALPAPPLAPPLWPPARRAPLAASLALVLHSARFVPLACMAPRRASPRQPAAPPAARRPALAAPRAPPPPPMPRSAHPVATAQAARPRPRCPARLPPPALHPDSSSSPPAFGTSAPLPAAAGLALPTGPRSQPSSAAPTAWPLTPPRRPFWSASLTATAFAGFRAAAWSPRWRAAALPPLPTA